MTIRSPRLLSGLALLACTALLTSASAQTPNKPLDKDHAEKMAKGLALFKQHVKPVLEARCLRCHGGEHVKSHLDLNDRDELLKGGSAGPGIVPGKHKDSILYKSINHQREPGMPANGKKLAPEVIAKFAEWIDLGAPYDAPLIPGKKKTFAWTTTVVPETARAFWSFQPLQRVAPPAVKNEAWAKTPLDRFILAKIEQAGIQPNPPAERRLLIRRAYFDLLGLPPTPEEVDAFVNDKSSDAYPKLLDKLLASPHYGERWGRHWLDLARFAESHGFEHDYDRPTAYHYRDFVIQALNDDLPYNTFVRWQLAGDELAPGNNLAQMATGFLAAGVHSTQITANEVAKHRYDEMDDKLATVGTAMLGLTFGCARCHDHKYDPIPQRDYYQLLSSFTTTVRSEVQMNFDGASYKQAKAAFDKTLVPLTDALTKYEREQLPARLAAWEKMPTPFGWTILDPTSMKSAGDATMTKQDDGSILVTGKAVKNDTFTFTAETTATGITAFRLEALADPSLVKGGPGRAANGNFALSDFQVTIAPKKASVKPSVVKLHKPRATFEQKQLPVAAAIDGDAKSAWAIDPQFGKDHAAIFETTAPIGFGEGAVLTFTLKFNNNDNHGIGRPRLALTTSTSAFELTAAGVPQTIPSILQKAAAQRSDAEKATLLKWFGATLDPEARKLHEQVKAQLRKQPQPTLTKVLIATEGLPAVRLHTQGGDFFPETHFLRRGDPELKEGVAQQAFLQVLANAPDKEKHWQVSPPPGARQSYRRTALANWLTDTEMGAGQLLARVIVNRLWQRHLGQGIVATASDFGARGERPTHPELLDYLATELIQNDWKLKHLHKLIMTSAVYMQSAAVSEERLKVDRDNKLFWRRPSRRLEAEAIRDSLLAVSGVLDPRLFGPGTLDEGQKRRSIYFTVKRSKLIPMMQIFDAPEALSSMAERPTTTIAPQALALMNNAHVRGYARSFAKRLLPAAEQSFGDAVKLGYRIAVCREPTAEDLADCSAFIQQQLATYPAATGREQALGDFCQVLMCLNEFIYVD